MRTQTMPPSANFFSQSKGAGCHRYEGVWDPRPPPLFEHHSASHCIVPHGSSIGGIADVGQDIFTAEMRPRPIAMLLLTSFSCFFSLCSTSLCSRSMRRFSRSADSASKDKSRSSVQPLLSPSSSIPSSLLCHATKNRLLLLFTRAITPGDSKITKRSKNCIVIFF